MENTSCEIDEAGNFDLPRKRPNQAVGLLLLLLAFFFTFHSSQLELSTTIESSSFSTPAVPKAPALEANRGVKIVSRAQGVFKLSNGKEGDLDTPQSKYAATLVTEQKLLKPRLVCQACAYSHYQRFYTGVIQPRAPPADLT